MRILLVEDTDDVAQAIVSRLSGMGHAVDRIADGVVAAGMVAGNYDLVILDVMLPGMDGFALLARLREAGKDTKVLMLTACGEIDERVRALDLGADDYLMKPFDYRELEARVRVLLRRTGGDSTNMLNCANLAIDRKSRAKSACPTARNAPVRHRAFQSSPACAPPSCAMTESTC